MTIQHHWHNDDEILVLDLYFRLGDKPGYLKTTTINAVRDKINPDIKTLKPNLLQLQYLNFLDSRPGISGASTTMQAVWQNFCHPTDAMRKRLITNTNIAYTAACKNRALLKRQVQRIIKKRTISRREARRMAVQMLYSAHVQDTSVSESASQWQRGQASIREKMICQDAFFQQIVTTIDASYDSLLPLLDSVLSGRLKPMSEVERAVLLVALSESKMASAAPKQVIINEAIEIVKQLGASGGHRIINGVLDTLLED